MAAKNERTSIGLGLGALTAGWATSLIAVAFFAYTITALS